MWGWAWTLSWWAINYSPGDVAATLARAPPLRTAARACLAVIRATIICHRADVAARKFVGVLAAPLVIGTLAGSGGKIISDAVNLAAGYSTGGCGGGLPRAAPSARPQPSSAPLTAPHPAQAPPSSPPPDLRCALRSWVLLPSTLLSTTLGFCPCGG